MVRALPFVLWFPSNDAAGAEDAKMTDDKFICNAGAT